jgi:hypothetical protein
MTQTHPEFVAEVKAVLEPTGATIEPQDHDVKCTWLHEGQKYGVIIPYSGKTVSDVIRNVAFMARRKLGLLV